jgi:hypothetical protein
MARRKGDTPIEDLVEMARRIASAEGGITAALHSDTWREFTRDVLRFSQCKDREWEATEAQLEGAEKGRMLIFERLPNIGIEFEHHMSLRGARYIFRHIETGIRLPWRQVEQALAVEPKGLTIAPLRQAWGTQYAWRDPKGRFTKYPF